MPGLVRPEHWQRTPVQEGKRRREGAAAFERVQEEELLALHAELRDSTYQPGPYHSFFIHDKPRHLYSTP